MRLQFRSDPYPKGVERCIRYAFEYCRKRNRRHKVTLCGKTNVLTYAFDLWERTFREVAKEFMILRPITPTWMPSVCGW